MSESIESKSQPEARYLNFSQHLDDRGWLLPIQYPEELPFEISRVFVLGGANSEVIRGGHANKMSQFVLIALSGSCVVEIQTAKTSTRFSLSQRDVGVFLPRLTWKEMKEFSEDCQLLVISDNKFDPGEYLSNFRDYLSYVSTLNLEEK